MTRVVTCGLEAVTAGTGLALVETTVTTGSAARGKTVADLPLAPSDTVATVVREGRPVPAGRAFRFRAGDRVLVLTSPGGEDRVHDAFYPGSAGAGGEPGRIPSGQ